MDFELFRTLYLIVIFQVIIALPFSYQVQKRHYNLIPSNSDTIIDSSISLDNAFQILKDYDSECREK